MPPAGIRAVVTDLDGTIVRADGTISDATRSAAARLQAVGIPLIVATARTPAGLSVLGPALDHVTFAVCCNGSLGYHPLSGKTAWRETLDRAAQRHVVATLSTDLPEAGFGAYDGSIWRLSTNYLHARGRWPSGTHQLATAAQIADSAACTMGIWHPVLTSVQVALALSAGLAQAGLAVLSESASHVLDVTPGGTDKGTGITRALALAGITPDQAIGFGDARNDLPMFAVLGLAIAVADAHPDVIAAADTVACDVDGDGFASTLRQLGLIDAAIR